MIKLLDTKNEVVDSVATSYEDSFTLESFQDMIQASHAINKSFILARVSTVDPKNPSKAFYSYYNAYQLNKVLFQTQVIKGKKYIHRLHVLNPLSNLDIVGDVLYFKVKPIKSQKEEKIQIEEITPSESAIKVDATTPALWTLAGPVSSPLSEEFPSDLKESEHRAFTYPVVRPIQMQQIKENLTIDMSEVDNPQVSPDIFGATKDRKISIIPKGAITRFATPISDTLPTLKRGNRRAFSWMNAQNSSKKQLTFEEWKNLAKKYKQSDRDIDEIDDIDKIDETDENAANAENVKDDAAVNQSPEVDLEYEAILFATDNDFLEVAKIRAYFRENAITPDDNKLFEMPTIEDISPVRHSIDDIRGRQLTFKVSD